MKRMPEVDRAIARPWKNLPCFVQYHKASWGEVVPQTAGRERITEKLWREFFSDPSQWWDNRDEKVNPRYPDFQHKKTMDSLWLDGKLNPQWVEAEVAAIAPGTLHVALHTWTRRLERHVKAGQHEKAMQLFQEMQRKGMKPDKFTFVPVLTACSSLATLEEGRRVHSKIVEAGYESDLYIGNALVDMYAKCGSMAGARTVFNNMPLRDVVAWTAMILGYVKCGDGQKALELFQQMQQERVDPNGVTFVGVLNACASVKALEQGKLVHKEIIERDYEFNTYVANSLVDMYAKCGSVEDAWEVFNKMPIRNVVAWNAMILGYVKCGEGKKALELSQEMSWHNIEPNHITFVGLLTACSSLAAIEEGKRVHQHIIQTGCESDVYVSNSLIDMYSKCGCIEDARRVFNRMPVRNVVSWTTMIMGYVKCGEGKEALNLSQQMWMEKVEPDSATFVGVLNACASVKALKEGRSVHKQVIQRGFEADILVGNSLVDMYVKCGSIEAAQVFFNKMTARDVVSWNVMILGYAQCGEGQKALELFWQMCAGGEEPDSLTFVGVLNGCANVVALEEGMRIHAKIIERGYETDVFVGNCLIHMYGKCGSIGHAQGVFNRMPRKDVISWSAMLAGYTRQGYAQDVFAHFGWMCQSVEVNEVTFVSLLSGCSHAGSVDEGLHFFESMSSVYNISPTVEHYACVIDLLGRSGRLHEAEDVIRSMPYEPNVSLWMSLLAACRVHENLEMGEHVGKLVLQLDPQNAAGDVLLSNIHNAAGKWDGSPGVGDRKRV